MPPFGEPLISLIIKTLAWGLLFVAGAVVISAIPLIFLSPSWLVVALFLFLLGGWLILLEASGLIKQWLIVFAEYRGYNQSNIAEPIETLTEPVELARIFYRLDDSENSTAFDEFLDEPLYSRRAEPDEFISSSQMVENIVLEYAQHIEDTYDGAITVNAEIQRGSLTVALTFLLNSYSVVAQLHDVHASISLVRRLLRESLSEVSQTYKQRTDRNVHIDSDVSIRGQSRASLTAQGQINASEPEHRRNDSEQASQPVTVTNTIHSASPDEKRDMNVNIRLVQPKRFSCITCLLGCILTVLFFAIIGLLYIYCGFPYIDQACYEIKDDFLRRVTSVLIQLAIYLDTITMPQQ